MVKIYYNKITRKGSDYTVADIPNVNMQKDVVTYAKSQVVAGKLSQEDYDRLFAPYESIY